MGHVRSKKIISLVLLGQPQRDSDLQIQMFDQIYETNFKLIILFGPQLLLDITTWPFAEKDSTHDLEYVYV